LDDRLRIFLWVAGSGLFGGLLGGAFGGVAGMVYWRSGKASGTYFGLGMARAVARTSERELSPGMRGAIVGAIDGALFLGLLGVLVGSWVALRVPGASFQSAVGVALIVTALVGGAAGFGLLAYTLVRAGVWGLAWVFGLSMAGAVSGFAVARVPGLLSGLVAGVLVGNLAALTWQRYAPRYRPPRVDRNAPPIPEWLPEHDDRLREPDDEVQPPW
jgi:hypothetical protein